MTWIATTPDGVMLRLRVLPRSSKNEVIGPVGDELKVRLQAAPVEGKANRALVKFLAKRLGVPAGKIAILSGRTGRHKRVAVQGTTVEEVRGLLLPGPSS